MTMLSPAATYHAELREQLGSVGRALSVRRGLLWLARGLAAGTVVVLGLVVWAWIRDAVAALPLLVLVGLPVALSLVTAAGSMFIRHNTRDLARRVDHAARLQERSTTALELGARGEEFPLALAQMRDAVEHLKRVDLLEAFPLRAPRNELMAAFFIVVIAALIGISPNPWLLRVGTDADERGDDDDKEGCHQLVTRRPKRECFQQVDSFQVFDGIAHLGQRKRELLATRAQLERRRRPLLEARGVIDAAREIARVVADEHAASGGHQTERDWQSNQDQERQRRD